MTWKKRTRASEKARIERGERESARVACGIGQSRGYRIIGSGERKRERGPEEMGSFSEKRLLGRDASGWRVISGELSCHVCRVMVMVTFSRVNSG